LVIVLNNINITEGYIIKLINDILNAKYFEKGSRDRLKAIIISLVILLSSFIMIIDVYESIIGNYIEMSVVEASSIIILLIVYTLFPKKLSLCKVINISLFVLTFLFILSLTIDGANSYFALFWLPTLTIYYFFFLGLKDGRVWSIGVVISLLLTSINAYFKFYPPLYTSSFLLQITVGYIAISYLVYTLEEERFGYEKSLTVSLAEREVLLKEIHHRTKNNMQIIIGLLDTQSFRIKDKKYKDMFQSHINRINSMAKIHEHLYRGKNFEKIEIDKYLIELIDNFQKFTSNRILADLKPLMLDISMAINISLILNEAVSNAIKYAYKDIGIIEVSLILKEDYHILIIRDYGVGFDSNKIYNSLGVKLIKDIAKIISIKPIEFNTDNGVEIKLYFNDKKDV